MFLTETKYKKNLLKLLAEIIFYLVQMMLVRSSSTEILHCQNMAVIGISGF